MSVLKSLAWNSGKRENPGRCSSGEKSRVKAQIGGIRRWTNPTVYVVTNEAGMAKRGKKERAGTWSGGSQEK